MDLFKEFWFIEFIVISIGIAVLYGGYTFGKLTAEEPTYIVTNIPNDYEIQKELDLYLVTAWQNFWQNCGHVTSGEERYLLRLEFENNFYKTHLLPKLRKHTTHQQEEEN